MSGDERDDAAQLSAATAMIAEMDLQSFDPEEARGFDGLGESFKSLLGPSAAAGRTLMMAGAPLAAFQDELWSLRAGKDVTPVQDAYFENVVDEVGTRAVESWRPNVASMGATAKALSMVNTVVGSVPQIIGAPALFVASSGVDPATELTRQGVDTKTAMAVGGVNMAVNALGVRLPAAFGSTLTTRLATGAGSNLGLGVLADASSAAALEAGGYDTQAQGYDAADPYARGLDVLMGLAFGARAHIDAPRLLPSQKDAVLAAMNADHFQRSTLPGESIARGADVRHQDGLDLAIKQILNGETIDVASVVRAEDFALRPELLARLAGAPSVTPGPGVSSAASYAAYRHVLESGGKADARPIDPRTGRRLSEAYGTDQFIPATWRTVVAKAKPSWAQGLTDAQLLEARSDPVKSAEMVAVLDAGHGASLEAAGLAVNRHTLYASHHFGINKGKAFARAGDSTRMELILTEGQLKANPYLKGMTKAEAIANWDGRAVRAGVDVAQLDAAPAVKSDVGLLPDMIAPRGSESKVATGAPRPTIAALRSGETLFPDPPARANLEEYAAWMEGRQRSYVANQRKDLQAIVDGAVPPSQAGLPTGQRMTADEARAQLGELEQMETEASNPFAASDPIVRQSFDDYTERQRLMDAQGIVGIDDEAGAAADGTGSYARQTGAYIPGGKPGRARTGADAANRVIEGNDAHGRAESTMSLARAGSNGDLVNVAGGTGVARPALAADGLGASQANGGTDSQGRDGRGSSDAIAQPLITAEAVARLDPALRIPTGELDADGNPITISAGEYLAAAKAEATRADIDARAIHAAADCFLRSAA